MSNNTRTKNSIINSSYAVLNKIATVILSFIVRTIFIKVLTSEYLGINGLFSNIITMLSLADLGIGIAIPYTLYKPLAENNQLKIKVLMKLYGKIYNIIGIIVLVIGISITPFLHFFIKEMPGIENLNGVYILFVINTAISYFFSYKKLLLDSDQRGYIANKIVMYVTICISILQILVLYFTRNYITYLLIGILSVFLQNLLISLKCNKEYPYIKQKTKEKISGEDIKQLKQNVSSLLIYRIGIVLLNGTDNLIISKMIGIIEVGVYSNYLMITNALSTIISQIFTAITSSIGNMVIEASGDKSEEILKKLQFLDFWLYSICSLCIFVGINYFIRLWIGEEYVLPNATAFMISLNFYIYGMQSVISSFRDAYGLFAQGKYRPIVMVIVNLVLSIALARYLGVLGVVIGTVVSRLFVIGIWDPIVVYRFGIKKSVKFYFVRYYKYLFLFIALSVMAFILMGQLNIADFISWGILMFVLFIVSNIIYIIIFHNKEEFKYFYKVVKNIIHKIIDRIRKG